ncbi:MAG TPA: hypothetical protein VGV89_00410 [Thermoplasmata archaeon]|nr:hypothetical protein [Thermoplasmata archaeon]
MTRRVWFGAVVVLSALVSVLASTDLGSAAPVPSPAPSAASVPGTPGALQVSWHNLGLSHAPVGRNRFGFAWDAADHRAVLYGGYNYLLNNPFLTDTWTYAAGNWTQLSPTVHPSAPYGLKLVYFPPLKGVIAFGGEALWGTAYYNDTWLFRHGNWTQLFPATSPPRRSEYTMAYDPGRQDIVLFGGTDGSSQELQDTWVFNGTTWAKLNLSFHPSGRQAASMVYDPIEGGVLLFGGSNASHGAAPGTWLFARGSWHDLRSTNTPLRVWTPVAVTANGTPVFLGGQRSNTIYNTTYEFYAASWHMIAVASAPAVRENGAMIYDVRDGYPLYFGGNNPFASTFYNDTLALY